MLAHRGEKRTILQTRLPIDHSDQDWDFVGVNTREYTHCVHDYPAKMIPQISRRLIRKYGKKGSMLFDPYCGSGTSLVEARLNSMDAVGTDLNPLARLIAEVKTRDYNLDMLEKNCNSILKRIGYFSEARNQCRDESQALGPPKT